MSIADKISGLMSAKSSLKTSIQNKGVTVPSSTKIDGYADLIEQIPTPEPAETLTVTCSTDQSGVSAEGQILTINGYDYTVPASGVVTAKIKQGVTYSIVPNAKSGYNTPATQSYTAASGPRSVTMQWTKLQHGVFILYTDGSLSNYDTKVSGKTPVGVVLYNSNVSLVLHPSEGSSKTWSPDGNKKISGVISTTNETTAKADYAGLANTNYMIAASSYTGTAFIFAREAVYADGRTGYLPACGEMEQIRLNATNINTALGLIGGTQLSFGSKRYWSSTQYGTRYGWLWDYSGSYWKGTYKYYERYCRSVAAF